MKKPLTLILGLVLSVIASAQIPINNLPPATQPLNGTDLMIVQQGNSTRKTPVSSVTTGALVPWTVPNGGTGDTTLAGILKGNGTAPVGTAAFGDITSLWTGPCNGGNYLRGDGVCNAINVGTVTSITAGIGITATPNPITSTGSIALTVPVVVGNGGTGDTTLSGVLKGNGTSPVTAAASSDIIALWTGTCDVAHVLAGNGTCITVGNGTVTSVSLTMPSGFTVVGSPITTAGAISVTTALNGVLKGNGSGFTTSTSTDIVGLFSSCSGVQYLGADGACHTPPNGTPGGANTDIQFNNGGVFGGSGGLTYDGASTVTLGLASPAKLQAFNSSSGPGPHLQLFAGIDTGAGNIGSPSSIDLGGPLANGAGGNVTISGGAASAAAGGGGSILLNSGASTVGTPGNIALQIAGTNQLVVNTDGGITVGSPTGGSLGAGSLNAGGLFINGVAVGGGGGGCAGANPTALVGLTAVNGVSPNCIRADGAPALDQSIAPTWTSKHTFTADTTGTITVKNGGTNLESIRFQSSIDNVLWIGSAFSLFGVGSTNDGVVANAGGQSGNLYLGTGSSFTGTTASIAISGTNHSVAVNAPSAGSIAFSVTGVSGTSAAKITASGAAPTLQLTGVTSQLAVSNTQATGLAPFTVATLPTCNSTLKGGMAYVTDATAPTYNATLTGGGAVVVPVFCNGSAWTSH